MSEQSTQVVTAFGKHRAEPNKKRQRSLARDFITGDFFQPVGHQWEFKFTNGYGASVIDDGYGQEDGLYEVAVLGPDGHLTYSTPITDDVLGYLTAEQVAVTLDRIEALA